MKLADLTYRSARRVVVAVIGGTVLLIGVAMLVLPGPALVVIPVGLAILGVEFAWARRLLTTVREKGSQAFDSIWAMWRARRAVGEAAAPPADGPTPPDQR